jgi:transposase-like protein
VTGHCRGRSPVAWIQQLNALNANARLHLLCISFRKKPNAATFLWLGDRRISTCQTGLVVKTGGWLVLTRFVHDTTVQTCIVHLVRHSLNFCGWKDRKNVMKDLKRVYQTKDDVKAEKALADFETEWGQKYPSIAPSGRRAWQEVIPFFAFPPAVRKIIYTTNS